MSTDDVATAEYDELRDLIEEWASNSRLHIPHPTELAITAAEYVFDDLLEIPWKDE